MGRYNKLMVLAIFLTVCILYGCGNLKGSIPQDTSSLLIPRLKRSEILGFVAGLGTTFASVPDLIAMLKRRSSAGMNPRMAGITGSFQILWVYYGLLIVSRPVILWNLVAVLINFLGVGAYLLAVPANNSREPLPAATLQVTAATSKANRLSNPFRSASILLRFSAFKPRF